MAITSANPDVAVIIPTHNRPTLLRRAVDSVLEQQAPGISLHIIVVDEASSPTAQQTLKPVVGPLTVIHHEVPVGPAAARNVGAEAIGATYVAFLDDDDTWLPGKLAASLDAFTRWPEIGAVFHRTAFHGSEAKGAGEAELLGDAVHYMLRNQPPHLDSLVVRQPIHRRVRFDEDFQAAEDLDYILRLAKVAPMVRLNHVLARHGEANSRATAISLDQRIRARQQLRTKHATLFQSGEADAFYWLRMGHLQRRAGRRFRSAAAFGRAARRRPEWAGPWKGLASLALPQGLVERVSRR